MATYFIIIALHLVLLSRSYTVTKFMNIPSKGLQFMVFPSRVQRKMYFPHHWIKRTSSMYVYWPNLRQNMLIKCCNMEMIIFQPITIFSLSGRPGILFVIQECVFLFFLCKLSFMWITSLKISYLSWILILEHFILDI